MVKKFFFFSVACVLSFLILEGSCSGLIFVYKFISSLSKSSKAFAFFTQYEKDLGWVSIPNYWNKDFYDPGVYVKTNSKGFRSDEEFDVSIPPDKLRIICSGDSFTFGAGVDNDHNWCQLLGSMDRRLQTVNMGEPGYGVDQMYLFYRRDGASLDHDIHIFAVIGEDFRRMQDTTFSGYQKPILKLRNGNLVAANVPVPREPAIFHWLALNGMVFNELRSFQLLGWFVARAFPRRSALPSEPTESQRRILVKILEDLQTINRQKDSILVFLYLPVETDYGAVESSQMWLRFLQDETAREGILFINLTDGFRKLPKEEIKRLFIAPRSQLYPSTAGHYSEYGHEYVAKELYSRLISAIEISEKLSRLHRALPGAGLRATAPNPGHVPAKL